VLQDAETSELLSGPTVIVRALASGGDERGRGAAVARNGDFLAIFPTFNESASIEELEVVVTRGNCETTVTLDVREDITVVDEGLLVWHITDPILVPPCEGETQP